MSAMSPVHSHTMSYSGTSHSLYSLASHGRTFRACMRGQVGIGEEKEVSGGVTPIRHLKFKFQTSTTHVAPHGGGNKQVNIWDSV